MRQAAIPILTNADMSSDIESIGLDINQSFSWSIQAVWTGEPTGSFAIQISNDIVPVAASGAYPIGSNPGANVINWTTYSNSILDVVADDGNWTWVAQLPPYRWIRLIYLADEGSGTVNATAFLKGA